MVYYKGWRQQDKNSSLMVNLKAHKTSAWSPNKDSVNRAMTALAELGITNLPAIDLAKLLPSDPFEPALNIMADVRAYFQGKTPRLTVQSADDRCALVAYKRFSDNVPLATDFELVRGLSQGVEQALYSGLGISGPDGRRICQELVQENPYVSARREELNQKRTRLDMASSELLSLGA
jgi:hypothetical protein